MQFKDRIKKLRKENNLNQQQIGDILGYRYTAISNYESGRNEPSIADLKKLAEFFDVSMDYLLCVNDIRNQYEPRDAALPDEAFLQKYTQLTPAKREQLSSLLDWVLAQK